MGRYQYTAFATSAQPRYTVIYDIHCQVIECERVDAGCDLYAALAATIHRLAGDGWQTEGEPIFGFVFIHRGGDRRLVTITGRNPRESTQQSFSPFRDLR